jgi:PAS domain S-box-containing protein
MPLNFNIAASLKTRVTLFTLLIFLIGMWSLALLAAQSLRQDMQHLLGEQQLSAVSYMAADIDRQLNFRLTALQAQSKDALPLFLQGAAALQAGLDHTPVLQKLFNAGVVVLGADGTVLADAPRVSGRVGASYLNNDHIAAVLAQGKPAISQPMMGVTQRAAIFAIAVPIQDLPGKTIGVLAGVVNLGQPSFLDKLSDAADSKNGGYLLLVDPKSRWIIASTDKTRVMQRIPEPGTIPQIDQFVQGYEGSAIYVNPLGTEVLTSSRYLPVSGWRLLLTMPTQRAFAPIYAMQQRMLIVTLVITLLAGVLTWWMLRRQLAPLQRTAAGLRAMVGAPLPLPALTVDRGDEIGEVVAGFNDLLERLALLQQAQREADFRWEFAAEGARIGVWDWNISTGEARYSKVWREMLGYTEVDSLATNQQWQHLIHPDDHPRVMQASQAYLSGASPAYSVEYRLRRKDQSYHWVQSRGVVFSRSDDGRPLRAIGTHADIDQRKLAELALQRRSAEFHSVLDASLDGFWRLDGQGQIVDVNPTMCLQSGYSRDELLGRNVSDVEDFESASDTKARLEYLRKHGRCQFETRHRRKDGSIRHLEVSATYRDVDGPSIFAFLRDISARRAAEQALTESETLLRTVIETETECIKIIDPQGCLLQMNPAGLAMIGADSLAQVLGSKATSLISPQHRSAFDELHRRVLCGETRELVYEVVGLKGQRLWLETRAAPMLVNGEVMHLAVTRDVTERKLSETALRVAAVAFESQEGMLITDSHGVIQRVNRAFTSSTGYTSEELVGKTPRLLQSGRHDPVFYRDMWNAIQRRGYWHGEIWDRRKNGEIYPKWLSISAVRNSSGAVTHYVGSHHEITDRKNAEAALRKLNEVLAKSKQDLQELAARTEVRVEDERKHVAREIHDELGQVMTALRMNLSLARIRHGAQVPALADELLNMTQLVDRAIKGVRNVASNLRPAALNMGLVPAVEWLCREFSQSSKVACAVHAPLAGIDLDEPRAVVIFRIVQESLTNVARYAQASQVSVTLGLRENELGVEVRDNGCGFDVAEAARKKSFGLLGMRERASALGGHVDVVSAPGQGTVIGVTIPLDRLATLEAP